MELGKPDLYKSGEIKKRSRTQGNSRMVVARVRGGWGHGERWVRVCKLSKMKEF